MHNMNAHTHASSTSGPSPATTVSQAPNTGYGGEHSHGVEAHTHRHDHWHNATVTMTIPAMSVSVPSHTHETVYPEHTHEVDLQDHEHAIVYGIFTGPDVAEVAVTIDGTPVPPGTFSAEGIGDIAPYLATDTTGRILRDHFHTIAIRPVPTGKNPNGLCRIRASWNAQVFISSLEGEQI